MSCGFPIELQKRLVPCGKCQGCLRRRRRAWVGRMLAEAGKFEESSFVTLTYDDDHLPLVFHQETGEWIPTLEKSHTKNWLRSVKRKATRNGLPTRFFMAAEYGEKNLRPHYHCILFGIGPTWRTLFDTSWTHGFQSWYLANAKTMSYVAKYCLKHSSDPEARLPTSIPHEDWDSKRVTLPPFRRSSRHPPIGTDLARQVAKAVSKPSTVAGMLEQEKFLKGDMRTNGDRYPLDRTMKAHLDRALEEDYGLDEVTRSRMLDPPEEYQPDGETTQKARQAHIRATARGIHKRSKL